MTGPEVFALVTKKKQKIEELLDPTAFTLNAEIVALEREIGELQANCSHEYNEHGECRYCGRSKD